MPESPHQQSMGRAVTSAFTVQIISLPLESLICTLQGAGSSKSARYLGLRILPTEISILLSWGISSTVISAGIISAVEPVMLTVISVALSCALLKMRKEVNSGRRQ